jgi:hypothetical protein
MKGGLTWRTVEPQTGKGRRRGGADRRCSLGGSDRKGKPKLKLKIVIVINLNKNNFSYASFLIAFLVSYQESFS